MELPLKGRIALVTGVGRKEGIGYAVCSKLASLGADIFFTYWKAYDLETQLPGHDDNAALFVSNLEKIGVHALSSELDLSHSDAPEKLLALVRTKMGEPSILIHNACVSRRVPYFDLSASELDDHYAVNVRATALLTRAFTQSCPQGSSIVHMTSGQALGVMDVDELPYTITKASIDMLVQQLGPALALRSIAINAVDPGPVDTGWITPELRAQLISEGVRINSPEEAAVLVLSVIMSEDPDRFGKVIHAKR